MNQLQLINNVMVRLRLEPLTNTTGTAYGRLMAVMAKDSHRQIAKLWRWTSARGTAVTNFVAGSSVVVLPNTTMSTQVRNVNVSSLSGQYSLTQIGYDEMTAKLQTSNPQFGKPHYYSIDGPVGNSEGPLALSVYPIPDTSAVGTVYANCSDMGSVLVDDNSPVVVPAHLVELALYVEALIDRGDEPTLINAARERLTLEVGAAIATDVERTPGELDWVVG